MNKGGKQPAGSGFTIVETMIVLAVSGGLLLSAILLINGRQNRAEFQSGLNNLVQIIQSTSSEVSSGYFPQIQNYTCKGGTDYYMRPTISNTPAAQGTNYDCIFIGKVIWFGIPGTGGDEDYAVYTIAGNKLDHSDLAYPGHQRQPASSTYHAVEGAQPVAIASGSINIAGANTGGVSGNYNVPDDKSEKAMPYGLKVYAVKYKKRAADSNFSYSGGLGFMDNVGIGAGTDDACSGFCNGTQSTLYSIFSVAGNDEAIGPPEEPYHIRAYPATPYSDTRVAGNTPDVGLTSREAVDKINTRHALQPVDITQLCIQSGTTNQSAIVTIGGSGQTLTTNVQIKNGKVAC